MKKRIKIDSSILSFVIILTGFLYMFPKLYTSNRIFDNVLDFIGVISILKGVLFRMSARGHKKAHSEKSEALVTTGPYQLVRNPMYLGSFMLGAGFILIVWPWWSLPIFALLFYMRFNKQMVLEEDFLTKSFGSAYQAYCRNVPRVFPSIRKLLKIETKSIINLEESFSTKETRGLFAWPALAFILETFQELRVFGSTDMGATLFLFMSAIIVFAVCFILMYQKM